MHKQPRLTEPVLIEGLPGIGFVANISALHLIRELKAERFAEIHSSYFQNFAVTAAQGRVHFPINELYSYAGRKEERDLIILYGNTQALTTIGQYEVCERVLESARALGCEYVITLGGLKRETRVENPRLFCTATDPATLDDALALGAEKLYGHIFGAAGLLIGLSRLAGIKGFCLLAETGGLYPDPNASRKILKAISHFLKLPVDLKKVEDAAAATETMLKSFSLVAPTTTERKKETRRHWFI